MGEIICTTTERGGKSIIYDLQIQNQNVKLDTKSMVIYTKNKHRHAAVERRCSCIIRLTEGKYRYLHR